MVIRIECPKCSHRFSIEPTAAMREIERLKKENSSLRAVIAAMESMKKNDPLGGLGKMFGL